ncbi:MAG: plasma-membrane choline transporter-domain-containing protein [Olpidium bornovanus]|uniref:Protein PNS1 n=1 Tax=Olpidium bornovanus TaxID=278681 RepID=A0A8H7ZZT9_9FUNG|nr:MAG: plasma-membrane choline transporter-domain-containing protein [Olpidium bornovanus]
MAYYGGNQPPVYPPQSPVYPPQNYQQGGGYPPPSQQWYPPQQQQQPGYPSQPPPFPHLHSPTKQPSSPPFDPGPPAPGYGAAFAGGASDTRLNFNPKPKYNDVWAAVLFVVHLVAFAYVSYLGLGALKNGSTRQNGAALFADTAVIVVLLFSAIIGFVLSAAYFLLIERIPFATIILETVTSVSKKYKGMFGVAILGLVLEIAYSVYFGFTVIKSVVHVTNSGVFAAYYFLEGSPQGMPSSPALGSLKRATTTSFGSICLGSLIIAVLRTAKAIVRGIASDTDNGCAVFCAMCLVCLLDWIGEFFPARKSASTPFTMFADRLFCLPPPFPSQTPSRTVKSRFACPM